MPGWTTIEESWYDEDKSRIFIDLHKKLMEILTTEAYSDIICWLPHGKGFIFRDKKRFAAEIMPLYFTTPTFSAFVTKLKRWHFERVTKGPEKEAYYHPKVRNPNMPTKKKAKKSNTQQSEDIVDADANQPRDASNNAVVADDEEPKPTSEDDIETDDDENDDDSMNAEDKELSDGETLNPFRSRRIAIAYLFLHVYGSPPESEWPNVARLIKKALHIPQGSKVDLVFKEIIRCKEKRIVYTGRVSNENEDFNRRIKIKLDSEEAQIIAKCIKDGMSLKKTRDVVNDHCLRAGIDRPSFSAIYTCVKKLGVNPKKYGSRKSTAAKKNIEKW